MARQRRLPPMVHRLFSACLLLMYFTPFSVHARDIGLAFIEDGFGQTDPRLSQLIVQELQPLLSAGDTLNPQYMDVAKSAAEVKASYLEAVADPSIDIIVASGLVASQAIYQQARFTKPTYLLRVVDPDFTGVPARDNVRNLQSYSTVNEFATVFNRLSSLFAAKRVAVLHSQSATAAKDSVGDSVTKAALEAGITVQFLVLDTQKAIEPQIPDVDAVLLPDVSAYGQDFNNLMLTLQRRKIPSFAVGGNTPVLHGALISDTLEDDQRVFARKVALDLQLAITGEARTRGMQRRSPKQQTTINIDTARAMGIDFALDELMTARVVQGNAGTSSLGFLSILELAMERNPDLQGQAQQLNIDEETLEQARASRRPQIAAQLAHTRRGDALPEQDTSAVLSASQVLYSPTANAAIDVAKLGLHASQSELEQQQLDTLQTTATAYFQALQTQAQFESSLRDLALNRENLDLAEQRNRSGSGSGAEIYRWQAIIAASESTLLSAYTANTSAQSVLAQQLNLQIPIPTTLSNVDLDQPPFDLLHEGIEPYLKSTGQAELLRIASAARALEKSPQLNSVASAIAINDTQAEALRRAHYTPELSLSATYAHTLDSSVNAAGVELDNEGDWTLALTAEVPIWSGGSRRSLIQQYQAQSALAATQLDSAQIELWASTNNAVNQLVANYRAIGLSELAEAAALKSQQITQGAYKLGAASVTELLDTQNEYRQAQDNAHIALYQYLTALVDFQALMGEMPMLKPGAEQQQWLQNFKQSMLAEAAQ